MISLEIPGLMISDFVPQEGSIVLHTVHHNFIAIHSLLVE